MSPAKDQRAHSKEGVEQRQGLIMHEEAQERQSKEEREKDDPTRNSEPTWHMEGEDRGLSDLSTPEKPPADQSTDSEDHDLERGNRPQQDGDGRKDRDGRAWTIWAQRRRHAPDGLRHYSDCHDQE